MPGKWWTESAGTLVNLDRASDLGYRVWRDAMAYAARRGVPIDKFCDHHVFTHHHMNHFHAVARAAAEIASVTSGADVISAAVAAAYHDIGRRDDSPDPYHGRRSAIIVKLYGLLAPWRDIDEAAVMEAIAYHADGMVTANPTVGAMWDADRLALFRIGMLPDPNMMSTVEGRRRAEALRAELQ